MLFFLTYNDFFAQQNPVDFNLSPYGVFDNVYDHYGKQYKLTDIQIEDNNSGNLNKSSLISCSTTSKFNLYFEPGCGMYNTSDPTENARRLVLCRVLQDISDFIIAPTMPVGVVPQKVNIWVRNINNAVPTGVSPNGILGLASGFYVTPSNTLSGIGGIIDNEIWKTIHTGSDSYKNVLPPLLPNSPNSGTTGLFYHGLVAFNFNTNNTPSISWNATLQAPTAGQSDLYSVILHEITHALGFESLMNENGISQFGVNNKYFNRFDKLLKNNANDKFLITSSSSLSTMYDYSFNNLLNNSILKPQTVPAAPCNSNTLCLDAIKYVGTSTVPIFTPKCFKTGSSLSHFEDQLYPSCMSPYGNNNYFVMSDANGTGPNAVKRYLKSEERNTLCDLGYSLKTTFGDSGTFQGVPPLNYYGSTVCNGIVVSGVNDGINPNNTYTYNVNANTILTINGNVLLSNDNNATGLEGLQDISAASTITPILGTNNFTYRSAVSGFHLLRYVPTNGFQKGNITYLYVYVVDPVNCAAPTSACNLVLNGDFEQNSGLPNLPGQINNACGWRQTNSASPDYFFTGATTTFPNTSIGIPCNFAGIQTTRLGVGNGYIGMFHLRNPSGSYIFSESVVTELSSALLPKSKYQLTFNVSLAESQSFFINKLQAYLSDTKLDQLASFGYIPIANPNMLKTNLTFSNNVNGWDQITLNFETTTGGEKWLYLGALLDTEINANIPAPTIVGCNYISNIGIGSSYYYLDNVSLIKIDGTFDLPATLACPVTGIPDLKVYLSGLPTNGIFTSPDANCVFYSFGKYNIRTVVSGTGIKTINYTYTNSQGCQITLTKTINILSTAVLPTFNFEPFVNLCAGAIAQILPTTSTNGISGTWTPAIVNNTISSNYVFTPVISSCGLSFNYYVTIVNNLSLVAVSDVFELTFSNRGFTTTTSVLTNDTFSGITIGNNNSLYTAFQLPTANSGGITINPNGTIYIPANTQCRTYYLNYKIAKSCNADSNIGYLQVYYKGCPTIQTADKRQVDVCYSANNQTTPTSILNNNTGADGVTINGVQADATNVVIIPITPLPSGVTISPNGTLNIAGGTFYYDPIYNYLPYVFYFKICPTGSTSVYCTKPIVLGLHIRATLDATYKQVRVSPLLIPSATSTLNVLENDTVGCNLFNTNYIPATTANVLLIETTNPPNQYLRINRNGFIEFRPAITSLPITTTPIALYYKICDVANPTVCINSGVKVYVYNSTASPRVENLNNSIFEKDINNIVVYPNPSNGIFKVINFDNDFKYDNIEIYNMLGQKMLENFDIVDNNLEIDLSKQPVGTYLLKISNNDQTIFKQLIKN